MSKIKLISVLERISEVTFQATQPQLSATKEIIVKMLNESNVKDADKKTMIRNINETKYITALQRYICNALLKYEGMGANQMQKTAREAAVVEELI